MPRLAIMFGLATICLTALPAPGQGINPTPTETNAFLQADRNRDGRLTQAEFRTFVRIMAAAGQSTARQIRFFGAYAYAFSVADADRNGVVTPAELRSADDTFRAGGG